MQARRPRASEVRRGLGARDDANPNAGRFEGATNLLLERLAARPRHATPIKATPKAEAAARAEHALSEPGLGVGHAAAQLAALPAPRSVEVVPRAPAAAAAPLGR